MIASRLARAVVLAVALALPRLASAQDPRLERRLDPDVYARVAAILDSARAAGLPLEPLVDKALEGASKRASGDRIVAAVQNLAGELRSARDALGLSSTGAELDAGASALHTGVQAGALGRLRAARPRQDLTVPLAVLADLVTRGVAADTAVGVVIQLAGVARDAELLAFQREVDRDVALGAPPGAAAVVSLNRTINSLADRLNGLPPGQPPRKP